MRLFLLRHGHAESEAPSDDLRPLSARGEMELNTLLQENYANIGVVDRIFVSPYLRTRQTAEVVAQYISAPQEFSERLVPDARIDLLLEQLQQWSSAHASIMLVSHQPLVGTLLDELGGFEYGCYRMGTGALAALTGDPLARGCCELLWLKQPQ